LSITVVDDPDPVLVGSELTFRITAFNGGPNAASSVRVSTEQLPSRFSDGTVQLVRMDAAGGCTLSDILVCVVGDLAAGAQASATVVVRPAEAMTLSTNWGVAPADLAGSFDPSSANNVVSVTTTVARP
jgi:uncharacterized protein DUF11